MSYSCRLVSVGAGFGGDQLQEMKVVAAGACAEWTLESAQEVGWWGDRARVYIASLLGEEQEHTSVSVDVLPRIEELRRERH